MELNYIGTKRVHDIEIVKTYEYGSFTLVLTIDMDGPILCEAFDKNREILIKAINDEKAIVTIEYACLSSKKEIEDFIENLKLAEKLMIILNTDRKRIISYEEE